MPIAELCAGYNGIGMAVEVLTGERLAYVAEVDPAASAILAHHFPDVPNVGDITAYDWGQLLGLVDVITAGFPCQDISNAGKREGINGSRSGIWSSVSEAVRVLRPRLVFLENVSAIRGRGLSRVLADLSSLGYDTRWTCIRASDIGAPHPRDRWFLLAFPSVPDSDTANPNSKGLEVGSIESPRNEQPAAERSGPGPQDPNGEPWPQRCPATPGQEEGGGTWSNP